MVYATTDAASANPLIKDFEALYPGIKVEYSDLNSTELYNRFIAEAAASNGTADVMWSSAMDLQVKLVADGHGCDLRLAGNRGAAEMGGVERHGLRHDLRADRVRLQQAPGAGSRRAEGPHRAAEAARAPSPISTRARSRPTIRSDPASAICSATRTSRTFPQAWDLFKAMGKAQAKLYTSAGAMMERVTSGEHLIAYGIFGSYALVAREEGPERSASCCRRTTRW